MSKLDVLKLKLADAEKALVDYEANEAAKKEIAELEALYIELSVKSEDLLKAFNNKIREGLVARGVLAAEPNRWAEGLVSTVERLCGFRYTEAESLRPGNTKHGPDPFLAALLAVKARAVRELNLELKTEAAAVKKASDESFAANRALHNKQWSHKDLVRDVQLAQFAIQEEEKRLEKLADKKKLAVNGSAEKKAAARKVLEKIVKGEIDPLTVK